MGRQDKKFANTAGTQVLSDQGFFRYTKRMIGAIRKKFGTHRIRTAERTKGNEFAAPPGTERAD